MHDRYLLLLSLLVISPFVISEVFALHYAEYGLDDRFNWREFDNENAQSVWIEFEGKMASPFDEDRLSFTIQDGTYEGDTRYGALFLMKDLPTAMLTNGTTTTFTWQFDQSASSGTPSAAFISVMDGNYTYNSVLEATKGFPSDINYGGNGNSCTSNLPTPSNADDWWDIGASGWWLCLGSVTGAGQDLGNIYGGGYLDTTGTDMRFATSGTQASGDLISEAISVTNAEWTEATEGVVTVFLIVAPNSVDSTNYIMQPRKLTITGTDYGTLAWNFPDTEAEVDNWLLYGGGGGINNDGYEINGTEYDHGYIFSYDPSVPDPPTNLWAYNNPSGGITLLWTEPVWTGLQPIDGYQIQRESPIGGGFSTLVANTGTDAETYTDTSIIPGNEYNYRVAAINAIGTSAYSNESKDGTQGLIPDQDPQVSCDSQVYELVIPAYTKNSATLCWNDILEYNATDSTRGYQINYTSPYGDPQVIVTNNTATPSNTKLVTNLAEGTQYSFRVFSWYAFDLQQVYDLIHYDAGTQTTGDLSPNVDTPKGVAINEAGTRLMVLHGAATDTVDTFNLLTPFDFDTNVWLREFNVATWEAEPRDLHVSPDGLSMNIIGSVGDGVDYFTMTNPHDTSTASHDSFLTYLTQIGDLGNKALTFGNSGSNMYLSSTNGGATNVYQYSCSIPYNGTSCTYDTKSLAPTECTDARGIQWDDEGDSFFCMHRTGSDFVYQHECTTNWDISTCPTSASKSKDINGLVNQGEGLTFGDRGKYMILIDDSSTNGDAVEVYNANFTGNDARLTNIANVTTLGGTFDIGEITFETGDNPVVFDWEFLRSDNGNNTNLLINYPNTFNASCNFDYKFAMTNQTYNNLSTNPVADGSERIYANFTFTNATNDIITVNCWDNNSNSTGKYLIPQTDFPILQQIADFRNGTFGTSGQFLIFDFVTLAVIILSMIGFNRVHPGVGAVFSAIILSGAAYFDIIEDWSAILGGIVIAVLLIAMLMHHRNDVV